MECYAVNKERCEQYQRQWHEPVRQQQDSNDQLRRHDQREHIARLEQGSDKCDGSLGKLSCGLRKEIQEAVEPGNEEQQSQKDPSASWQVASNKLGVGANFSGLDVERDFGCHCFPFWAGLG